MVTQKTNIISSTTIRMRSRPKPIQSHLFLLFCCFLASLSCSAPLFTSESASPTFSSMTFIVSCYLSTSVDMICII